MGAPEYKRSPMEAKSSIREIKMPVRNLMLWQQGVSQKVVGLNTGAHKGLLSFKISFNTQLQNLLVVEFLQIISVGSLMCRQSKNFNNDIYQKDISKLLSHQLNKSKSKFSSCTDHLVLHSDSSILVKLVSSSRNGGLYNQELCH